MTGYHGRAQAAIHAIGGQTGLHGRSYRCSYYCIGVKGMRPGLAIEAISSDQPLVYPDNVGSIVSGRPARNR